MKEKRIKVVIKRPYEKAKVMEIDNDLKTFQGIVGGHIERVPFPKLRGVDIWVNEEGKLLGLDGNFFLPEYNDCVCGTAYICSYDKSGNCTSLTDEQIATVCKYIDIFALQDGESLYQDYYRLTAEAKEKYRKYTGGNKTK